MSQTIDVMVGALTRDEIEERIGAASGGWLATLEREIYYPYHRVLLRHQTSTFLGRSAMPIQCVVDARTRLAATTDPFELSTVVRRRLKAATIVDPQVSAADAVAIAERYAAYVMRNRRKALVESRVDLLEQALVYKPMATVRVSRKDAASFRVLVDGMSGAFHVLSSAPETRAQGSQPRI